MQQITSNTGTHFRVEMTHRNVGHVGHRTLPLPQHPAWGIHGHVGVIVVIDGTLGSLHAKVQLSGAGISASLFDEDKGS